MNYLILEYYLHMFYNFIELNGIHRLRGVGGWSQVKVHEPITRPVFATADGGCVASCTHQASAVSGAAAGAAPSRACGGNGSAESWQCWRRRKKVESRRMRLTPSALPPAC